MKTEKAKCKSILKRPYLKDIIRIKLTESSQKIPRLRYSVDIKALNKYANTYLGNCEFKLLAEHSLMMQNQAMRMFII